MSVTTGTDPRVGGYPAGAHRAPGIVHRSLDSALDGVAEIVPAIRRRAERDDRPHLETFDDIKAAGLPSFVIPVEYGGGGATLADASQVIRALAAADGSAALVLAMHYIHSTRLLGGAVSRFFAEFARNLAASNSMLNFAASEGRSGAPSRGGAPRTTATRVPSGWEINGSKGYVTGSIGLDFILVTAQHVDADDASEVHTLLVPTSSPGVRIEETWDTIGLRGTASHDVLFDGVCVSDESVVAAYDPNTSQDRFNAFYNYWSLLLASIHLGIATAARSTALAAAATPRRDGIPGTRHEQPWTRTHAANLELALLQAETLLDSALVRVGDSGGAVPALGPAIKMLVHGHATDAVDAASRLVGGASVWNESDLSRYYRDLRVALFNPPNDDVVAERVADVLFQPGGGTLLAHSEGSHP